MTLLRNIFIAALLVLLALAAGIKGYIHHQFKNNIDNGLSSIQHFAKVNYSDLSTEIFSGKVLLENVRISSEFLPEAISLGNITLKTPGFKYMLNGPENIKKGVFPKHLSLAIDDVFTDLHGKTAELFDRVVNRMQPIYARERKLCAGKSIFGPSDYKKMGYTRLLSNMRIAYNFNEMRKSLKINVSARTHNVGRMNVEINISNLSSTTLSAVMQAGKPQLTNVEITYNDENYAPRMVKYCAALSNMTKEAFVNAEIKQSDKYFYMVWGFSPKMGLRKAYKNFLLKPDLVTLTMDPAKDFNPMMIATMSRYKLMDTLNVRLKVNGLPIPDLRFKLPPPKFTENLKKQLANSLDFETLLRGDPIKPPVLAPKVKVKLPAKYHKITLAKVSKHINNFVQITTNNGSVRKGKLMRIDAANLYVQKKVGGGKFTMAVPRENIKTIEAYFSKIVMP